MKKKSLNMKLLIGYVFLGILLFCVIYFTGKGKVSDSALRLIGLYLTGLPAIPIVYVANSKIQAHVKVMLMTIFFDGFVAVCAMLL